MAQYVILVAGGKGHRMGEKIPKQFLLLNGKPVLMHTIEAFHSATPDSPIVLVLPEQSHQYWEALCEQYSFHLPHTLVPGGEQRFHSVKNGLNLIFNNHRDLQDLYIAIHDGVRPLASSAFIQRTFAFAHQHKTAIPALPCSDSIRIQEDSKINYPFPRKKVFRVQTPQIFSGEILKKAFEQEYDPSFTDDASVVEKAGYPIHMTEGDIRNIKITYPADLALATYWLTSNIAPDQPQ